MLQSKQLPYENIYPLFLTSIAAVGVQLILVLNSLSLMGEMMLKLPLQGSLVFKKTKLDGKMYF